MGTGRVSGSTAGLCPLHQTQPLLEGSGVVGCWLGTLQVQVTLVSTPQEGDQLPVAMAEPHKAEEHQVPTALTPAQHQQPRSTQRLRGTRLGQV